MHWPLCNATKGTRSRPSSPTELFGCWRRLSPQFSESANRGWPGFGASAFFFFFAMAVGARRPRPRRRFPPCSAGLGLPARAAESFGSSVTTQPCARAARPLCLWLGCAVVFGSRAAFLAARFTRPRKRPLMLCRWTAATRQRAARRAASARRPARQNLKTSPVPDLFLKKRATARLCDGTGSRPAEGQPN